MKNAFKFFAYLILYALLFSCSEDHTTLSGLDINRFSTKYEGKITGLYVLKNKEMEVCVTNFGGRIVSVMVPDRNGIKRDVVLGFNSIDNYINVPSSFGATIGRVANRINMGKFTLDNKEYNLPVNSGVHCIHGGNRGFQYRVFDVKKTSDSELVMNYVSSDGEEGFPGKLNCEIKMVLTEENAIDISYRATTDKPTVVNMTNHSFFNLDGDPSVNINDYTLWVDADYFTPLDSSLITTGEIISVSGTPLDFTEPQKIGKAFQSDFRQLSYTNGIDHNFVLNKSEGVLKECAKIYSSKTGIMLSVCTNEPGLQVYTANSLNGKIIGKKDILYKSRCAVCLETQHFPDSPNKKQWPSVVLLPGKEYYSRCIYKFSVLSK